MRHIRRVLDLSHFEAAVSKFKFSKGQSYWLTDKDGITSSKPIVFLDSARDEMVFTMAKGKKQSQLKKNDEILGAVKTALFSAGILQLLK